MEALGDDSSTTSSAPAMMEEDLTQGPFPFFLHGKEQQNIIIIHIIRLKSACLLSDCSLRPLTWPSTRAAGQNSAALLLLSCSKKKQQQWNDERGELRLQQLTPRRVNLFRFFSFNSARGVHTCRTWHTRLSPFSSTVESLRTSLIALLQRS